VYALWIAFRRAIAVGLAVAVAVGAVLYLYAASQPAMYQARFSLLATPSSDHGRNQDFSPMVSFVLPGLTQLARSPSVLEHLAARLKGAPDIDQLASQITVEIIPDSGFGRITVEAESPVRASRLAHALSHQIHELDLLAPVGTFRTFDSRAPVAEQTSPDLVLATGFALAAGTIAGLIAGGFIALRRPRILGKRQAAPVVNNPNVPILVFNPNTDDVDGVNWLLSRITVNIVPVGDQASKAAKWVRRMLEEEGQKSQIEYLPDPDAGVVLVAVMGRTTPEQLANSCAIVHSSRSEVVALALVSPRLPGRFRMGDQAPWTVMSRVTRRRGRANGRSSVHG
jgi:capsular polysaccharide biosynthesis protein